MIRQDSKKNIKKLKLSKNKEKVIKTRSISAKKYILKKLEQQRKLSYNSNDKEDHLSLCRDAEKRLKVANSKKDH